MRFGAGFGYGKIPLRKANEGGLSTHSREKLPSYFNTYFVTSINV